MTANYARHEPYRLGQQDTSSSSARGYSAPTRGPSAMPASQGAVDASSEGRSIAADSATSAATHLGSSTTAAAVVVPTLSAVAYFTAAQLENLYARNRGSKMSTAKWQTNRILATGFIQATASRLGFPQRTIAAAQQIYQRFHLFYSPVEFVLHEVAVTSLFVAAKLNDTPKKAREILLASYALRFPHLVKGASSEAEQTSSASHPSSGAIEDFSFPTLAGQKRKATPVAHAPDVQPRASFEHDEQAFRLTLMAIGSVSEGDVDPSILETDRKRLMALEKLVLESLCFNFHLKSHVAFKMVIKLGRLNRLPKAFLRTAWKVAADMHRTTAPLQYPPNVIALASLYAAALLSMPPSQERTQSDQQADKEDPISSFIALLNETSASANFKPNGKALYEVEDSCHICIEDVEEAIHELLDLYLTCVSQLPPSLYMQNPGGTATPSPHSPADTFDMLTSSPSSSTGLSDSSFQHGATARRKLKQYEYAPPPFGLVDWLNSRRYSHLQEKNALNVSGPSDPATSLGQSPDSASAPISTITANFKGSVGPATTTTDPTLPAKELSALLTALKIFLRGMEYGRQKADDALLASLGAVAKVDITADSSFASNANERPAATSVSITLGTLPPEASPNQKPKPFDVSKLRPDNQITVERIVRRKMATSLRNVFVEPKVVLKPKSADASNTDKEVAARHNADDSHIQGQNGSGASGTTQKRIRIDHATRYLF